MPMPLLNDQLLKGLELLSGYFRRSATRIGCFSGRYWMTGEV
jgi:hypothetical protein